jgi:oxygen-independent coproporphyrinogen-3 oxidase
LKTFNDARKAGFNNINIDLIFNIPGQTIKEWKEDLEKITKLNPEHISAYSLTVEKNTILHGQILKGNISMPSEEIDLKMFEYSQNYLNKNNYSQYEISNYALQGMECKHNLHYWNLDSYLAFGPAAHGYDGKVRWWNVSSLDNYMEKIKTNQSAVAEKEILNEMKHFNEIIFNGIRTKNGIKLKKLASFSSYSNDFNASLKKWNDKLNISTKYVQLKKEAYKFADEIASDMMEVSN